MRKGFAYKKTYFELWGKLLSEISKWKLLELKLELKILTCDILRRCIDFPLHI